MQSSDKVSTDRTAPREKLRESEYDSAKSSELSIKGNDPSWETSENLNKEIGYNESYKDAAFVELSPESIDVLATEVDSQSKINSGSLNAESISRELQSSRSLKNAKGRYDGVMSRSGRMERSSGGATQHGRLRSDDKLGYGAKDTERRKSNADSPPIQREDWQIQKEALQKKFPEAWNPRKRLSPDALVGIRALHAQMPEQYTTAELAKTFEVSPEAIRRILKSKWTPSADEELDRQQRWFRRGEKVWSRYAELGVKPPKRWRELGIGRGRPEKGMKKPPALVTTSARTREPQSGGTAGGSLSDRIL